MPIDCYFVALIPHSDEEFAAIEARLVELGVVYEALDVYKNKKSDPLCFSRAYHISVRESIKLPHDAGQPYLPVDTLDAGHALIFDKDNSIWQMYQTKEHI